MGGNLEGLKFVISNTFYLKEQILIMKYYSLKVSSCGEVMFQQ